MAIQVMQPDRPVPKQEERKTGIFERIMQGLEIAGGITGLAVDYRQLQEMSDNRENKNKITPLQQLELGSKGFQFSTGDEGPQPSNAVPLETTSGQKLYARPPEFVQKAPDLVTKEAVRDGRVVAVSFDPNTGDEYGVVDLGPEPQKQTTSSKTFQEYVDDKGNTRGGLLIDGRLIKSNDDVIVKPALDRPSSDLEVPGIGVALNREDAKIMKDAVEQKAKFDRQLGEMIELRKKYGAEVANRSAVRRGKQLSKDLLLTYKNLAKLGVLSKSDEDIINAIIPSDPLEFNVSGLFGQDPTLVQLESLRNDVEQDFLTTVRNRMRDGGSITSNVVSNNQDPLQSLIDAEIQRKSSIAGGR